MGVSMIKALHTADNHLQKKRIDEAVRNFRFIVDRAKDVDVVFIAGDLFDRNTTINSREYNEAVGIIHDLSNIAPVYIVRGNHDPENSLDVFSKIGNENNIHVYNDVFMGDIEDRNGNKLFLLALPYLNPGSFGSQETIKDVYNTATDYINSRIAEFIAYKTSYPKVIMAHLSVFGAELANSEQILSGEVMLSVDVLNHPDIDAVMLGHIHRNKQSIFNGTRIRYAGAHYRTRFDELATPGFCMWEIEKGNTRVATENTPARDMCKIVLNEEQTNSYIATGKLPFDIPADSDVSIVAEVSEGFSHLIDKSKTDALNGQNGSDVKFSTRVVPKVDSNVVEIHTKSTLAEKFIAWGNANNFPVPDTMVIKLNNIEIESRN